MTVEMVPLRLAEPDAAPDFAALARLRRGLTDINSFLQESGSRHGCTASMYQLLLAVKTGSRGEGLDIGMVANALAVRHPSAAEMVRKAATCGLLRYNTDADDRRRVLVELTDAGEQVLRDVASDHLAELRRLRPAFIAALRALD
jgi:DNA-binding MarR family transcriptional regulator